MDRFRARTTLAKVVACLLLGALTICGVAYAATRLTDNRVALGSGDSEGVAARGALQPGSRIATPIGRTPRRLSEARPASPSSPAKAIAERHRPKPVRRRAIGFRVAVPGARDGRGPSGQPSPVAVPVADPSSPHLDPAGESPPPATEPPEPEEAIEQPSSIYWGAAIGNPQTGAQAPWNMQLVTAFEEEVGKPLSLIHLFSPFADCSRSPCSFYKFPTEAMENIRRYGAIPFFSWASNSTPTSLSEPNFQLADVVAGSYDSYIREFAQAAKRWGHPFFLRFNWEMNGNWFPWSESVNGNGPGEFVAAWRHVHDIFASVGATNVTWVWCPNVDPEAQFQDIASLYPGDAYVDWTSLDGYNSGTNPERPDRWRTFSELFSATYHQIVDQIAPSKPMVVGEVGSSEYGGSKAEWISEMLADLPTEFPQMKGILWFDERVEGDWPISTSASATAAFSAGIQSPVYTVNDYASLAEGVAVTPPGE